MIRYVLLSLDPMFVKPKPNMIRDAALSLQPIEKLNGVGGVGAVIFFNA